MRGSKNLFGQIAIAALGMLSVLTVWAGDAMKVGSWNLQFFTSKPYVNVSPVGGLPIKRSKSDIELIKGVVDEMDVDVLALQEIADEESLNVFSENYVGAISGQATGEIENLENSIHNAILVHRRISHRVVSFFSLPGTAVKFRDKRDGVFVERISRAVVGVEIAYNGVSKVFLSVHLKSGGCETGRLSKGGCKLYRRQLLEINRSIRELVSLRPEVSEVWLMGDFNRALQKPELGDPVVERLAKGFSTLQHKMLPKFSRTFCQGTPRSRRSTYQDRVYIDYLLCLGNSKEVCSAGGFREYTFPLEAIAFNAVLSDHCPISALIGSSPSISSLGASIEGK